MNIRPVAAEFFQADGRADMTKLTDDFRNFANAPYHNGASTRSTFRLH